MTVLQYNLLLNIQPNNYLFNGNYLIMKTTPDAFYWTNRYHVVENNAWRHFHG